MFHKYLHNPIIVNALLTITFAFVLVQLWGTSLRYAMSVITVMAIYGLLILSYLLRIALIFFGLFALFRMLWQRAHSQNYSQMEV